MPTSALSYDVLVNAKDSLNLVATVTKDIRNTPTMWKWVILATHDALQNFLVCALSDTTQTAVLKPSYAKEILAFLEGTNHCYPQETRLKNFPDLLKLAKKKSKMKGKPLIFELNEKKIIEKMHRYRNDFIHFSNYTWLISQQELFEMTMTSLKLIKQLNKHPKIEHELLMDDLRPFPCRDAIAQNLEIITANLNQLASATQALGAHLAKAK